jgi:NodT family efflux transporter outer membrane factor (OMF) lipoprotein
MLALLLVGGCAVGPDFTRPAPPKADSYTAHPLTTTSSTTNLAAGTAQRFVEGLDIPGEWWEQFHSKQLNALIERSLTNNPDLKAAQASLVMARENVLAHRGIYYPSIAAGFGASRHRTPNLLSPFVTQSTPEGSSFYSFYTPQLTVSYSPDVFGLNRRTGEALKAQQQAVRYAEAATYITLTANVAGAAIQEASLRAQIEATHRLVEISSNMLEIVQYQYEKGAASMLDVRGQEAQLAQVTATLPPLRRQLAQQRDLLAVLAGVLPTQEPEERFELSGLELPEQVPVSLPSKLVEHRPDVRQAEENLHSACAQIGVAIANRLPNVTLTADAGSIATGVGALFTPDSMFWDLGAGLTQPIFQGGTLLHQERAARAAFVQAAEQYRSTVLTAFQNVADTLNALEEDANGLKAAAATEEASKAAQQLTEQQLNFGLVAYAALLSAQQTYQQALINLAQAQANRYADTVALFQALGGGWWHRAEFSKD